MKLCAYCLQADADPGDSDGYCQWCRSDSGRLDSQGFADRELLEHKRFEQGWYSEEVA